MTSTAGTDAPRVPVRRPRREHYPDASPAAAHTRHRHRCPDDPPTTRAWIHGLGEFTVTPLERVPDLARSWELRRVGAGSRGAAGVVVVAELDDPEGGCELPGYLGLVCTCTEYLPGRACGHLTGLVALGLLRPAPGWDQWDDSADARVEAVPA